MRLMQREGKLIVQFTLVWEVSYLAEQAQLGDHWVRFTFPGKSTPIGEIHASTHQVRLFPGYAVRDRQAVTLCVVPPEETAWQER